jgi:hypothetical protein
MAQWLKGAVAQWRKGTKAKKLLFYETLRTTVQWNYSGRYSSPKNPALCFTPLPTYRGAKDDITSKFLLITSFISFNTSSFVNLSILIPNFPISCVLPTSYSETSFSK